MPSLPLHSRAATIAGLMLIVAVLLLGPATASAQTGTINFTVTNAATGSPVAGISVRLVASTGTVLGSFTTSAGGTASVSFLPAGSYFAYTDNAVGLIDEFYDNLICPYGACTAQLATSSTPIVLTPGSTRAAAFALQPGGSIAGTVRDAATNLPLPTANVKAAILSAGRWVTMAQTYTNAAGAYTLVPLVPGTYQVFTDLAAGYVDEFLDNVPCHGQCDPFQAIGEAIPVGSGTTVTGRDFALSPGGQVTGIVTDVATGTPLSSVAVYVYWTSPESYRYARAAATDALGRFTVGGLATGVYAAFTVNQAGYVDEMFDDIPCLGSCDLTGAADIPVTTGQSSTRNFALARGGTIAGTVRNGATSAPVSGVSVEIYARRINDSPQQVAIGSTNASGAYSVAGLPTGTYYAAVSRPAGLVGAIYPAIQCPGICDSFDTIEQGQPIEVVAGATAAGRNFSLTPAGQITGVITNTATGAPLPNASVYALANIAGRPRYAAVVATDNNGAFTISSLPGGSYYLFTANNQGLVNMVFPGVPCLGDCPLDFVIAAGTAVVVTTGVTTSGRNLALSPGGRVSGTVTDATTGARLEGIGVRLFANVGGSAQSTGGIATDALGRFVVDRLPAGVYYAASLAGNQTQLVNEIYDNLPCTADTFCTPAAAVAAGTPIQVVAGATTASRDFALQRRQEPPGAPMLLTASSTGFEARFTWREPATGSVPTSYRIEAGVSPGATAVVLPATGTTLTVPGAPAGRFFVRVRAINAYGIGPPSDDVVLDIAGNGASPPAAPRSLSAFMAGSRLIATWQAPFESGPVAAYRLEAGSASGLSNIAVMPVGTTSFSFEPVPIGFYFLRVRALSAAGVSSASNEVLLNVGGVPSPPGMPLLTTMTVTGSTVSLAWAAPRHGAVSTYVLEAGSASGLANLVVHNTGNAATTISFSGVAPGTYFVRVRAANGLGAGIVSNEVTVVVP